MTGADATEAVNAERRQGHLVGDRAGGGGRRSPIGSSSIGNGHLFWFVIGFGMFAVVAMWVFPEAVGKGDAQKKG